MIKMNRRKFLKLVGAGAVGAAVSPAAMAEIVGNKSQNLTGSHAKKVIILGIDGMDPTILTKMMDEGKMPTFAKLAKDGSFSPLGTSIPPQSPVAWSNFITGMDPGGHGIFDFIHREPESYLPFLSTSKTQAAEKTFTLGDWVIPMSSGKTSLLRKGKAFWQILEEHGIQTTVIKMPANFPPAESSGRSLSGMGTPDILGTYGTFSLYTDNPAKYQEKDITGGKVYPVNVYNNTVTGQILGPKNSFRKEQPDILIDFTVHVDSEHPVAKIVVQDREILMNAGEFSDWVQLKFVAVPYLQSVSGICRFYLKQVHPDFELYVSPINIDPTDPALPISTPKDYSADLAEELGCFYTQGFPEDTKAFSVDALGVEDYLKQTAIVLRERLAMYDYALDHFNSGLLFFYFCSLDQNSHMLWWLIDPKHPIYQKEFGDKYGHVLFDIYTKMDAVLEKAMQRVDNDTTIIVMSDHGFSPFYRCFNLNKWLKDNGYITLTDDEEGEFYSNVNWLRTRAYGLGLNGLYINQRGREGMGIVDASEKKALLDEIAQKLAAVRDPQTGEQVVLRLYQTQEVYTNPDQRLAPDAIVGYNRGYRASWETAIGSFPKELITDNDDRWSGDHCMAAEVLSGVYLSNRKLRNPNPSLSDITPAILLEFGIEPPENMTGRPV
jgi:predicted AlkP superfamily phosphohydrolase/phosphomutase